MGDHTTTHRPRARSIHISTPLILSHEQQNLNTQPATMSDNARKPLTDRVGETITPDSQKSYADKAKETTTGTADNIAGMVRPGDNKSTSQKLSDEASSKTGTAQDTASNLTQKASSTAGSTTESVQTRASDLGQKASENTGAAQKNLKDTASNLAQQASETAGSAQKNIQETASILTQQASETAGAAQKNIQETASN